MRKPFKSLFQKLEWAFLLYGTEASGFYDIYLKMESLPFMLLEKKKQYVIKYV
jgi:hypothetical protein